ncbi:MAG: hypothetical protein PUH85_00590 [Firmicutes bacterium]|nr:hypothetical protein [Erysipelotrichaceae bacterium]MDD7226881.1 hypothetical protein [Bacillota bacterium]MDY5998453.1 hypothetical protein [Erysipelotrichaceae bacterium]
MEYLKVIGYLIGYHRKLQNIKINNLIKFNDYIKNRYCKDCQKRCNKKYICSDRTLYKIENGSVVNDECVYINLIDNLNMHFTSNRILLNKLDLFKNIIVECLLNVNKSSMISILNDITVELDSSVDTIYVSSILNLYKDIIQYKLYEIMPSSNNLKIYIFLYDKLDNINKNIIINLFYTLRYKNDLALTFVNNNKNYFDYENRLLFEPKLLEIREQDYIKGYETISEIDINYLNDYQQFLVFNSFAFIQLNLNLFDKCKYSLEKCLDIYQKNDYPIIIGKNTSRQLAMVSYMLNDYEDCINYLKMASNDLNDDIMAQYALLFDSYQKLNRINEMKQILKEINTKTLLVKEYVIYYKLKYEKDLDITQMIKLEDYINQSIVPIINKTGMIFKNIFKKEIMTLVSQTKRYKSLFIYEETTIF